MGSDEYGKVENKQRNWLGDLYLVKVEEMKALSDSGKAATNMEKLTAAWKVEEMKPLSDSSKCHQHGEADCCLEGGGNEGTV